MKKPSWKDAPKWAKWLAMDADGFWWWYEEEPVANEKSLSWGPLNGGDCIRAFAKPPKNWRETLTHRPEET